MASKQKPFDVVIVGGSTAGLSAALDLGRSTRSVLIIDSDSPCNRFQGDSHNLLGFDGVAPAKVREQAIANVMAYPTVQWKPGTVTKVRTEDDSSRIDRIDIGVNVKDNEDISWVQGRKLIIATGAKDLLPEEIKGVRECWGKSIIHCPYCHGYEFASKRTVILNMEPSGAIAMAPLLRNLTNKLFVVGEKKAYTEEELASLETNGVEFIDQRIVSIKQSNGDVETLKFDDNTELAVDVAYLRPGFAQRFPVDEMPALKLNGNGYIDVHSFTQKTSVPNVYACGDCTTPMRALSIAMAAGTAAGAMLNHELSMNDWKA